MSTGLHAALARVARTSRLLVACDYDGVLAEIVADRSAAKPDPESLGALRALAGLEQTDGAIVSGRALEDLSRLVAPGGGLELVGSHGAERARAGARAGGAEAAARLVEEVTHELRAIAASAPGLEVERKPLGAALHYRRADPVAAENAVRLAEAGAGALAGVRVVHGRMVVELLIGGADKGRALHAMRRELGATAVVFVGDDRTDEDAFAVLGGEDLGVHVGSADTLAGHRLASTAEVGPMLRFLVEARRSYLREIESPRIHEHSLLSDQRTIVLVDARGRVTWGCFPRLDSPALFGALLGGPGAGSFDVLPEDGGGRRPVQSYVGDTMTLRTDWGGGLVVHDYLDCGGGRAYQRAGRSDLVRVVEGGRAVVRFAPRPDFARGRCALNVVPGGLVLEGMPDPVVLAAPGVEWTITNEGGADTAIGRLDASAGPVVLELRYGSANLRAAPTPEPRRRAQSERPWSLWAESLRLPGLARDAVRRGALVLKALAHGPTGAIAAAGTTSLPEWPGGERNWDYRYCWPRDAFMAAGVLVRLGNTGHAMKLMDWLLGILDRIGSPERLRPIYTVTGQEPGSEAEITSLRGYAGSRPVRVGNAAAGQVQLDVFGPIVETAWLLATSGASLSPEHLRIVERVIDAVERRWAEPDHGIWELRLAPRHHVHSRTMCWFAVDRGIGVAEEVLGKAPARWSELREAIRRDVLEHGYDRELGAFTTAYGVPELDAAALTVGLTGLVPRDDPRWGSTVRAVGGALREGTTVMRYRLDDGIPGREGGWHLCTGWYIEALAGLGRVEEARGLFDAMLACAGPTGMLAEQHCPRRGSPLGNVPQAYSHLAVIRAALALEGAA